MEFLLQPGVSQPPPPAYHQLKRGRPSDAFKFDPLLAPKLPPINDTDTLLQVFTHPSIRQHSTIGMAQAESNDNERLSFIGGMALDQAVTEVLLQKRPMIRAQDIMFKKQSILTDESFDDWVKHYKLLRKLRCAPELRHSSAINRPQYFGILGLTVMAQETRAIFHAYAGGIYVDSGCQVLSEWVTSLLAQYLNGEELPEGEPMVMHEMSPPPVRTQTPPPTKKVKAEAMSPPPFPSLPDPVTPPPRATFFGSQPQPVPVPTPPSPMAISHPPMPPPPPLPISGMNRPNPLSPAQPGLPFLPLFNQTAAQRRVQVEYNSQFSGPSHAGTWLVRCIVNGISKGEGKGNSKQTAKEEAARQAFYNMGWT